MTVFNVGMTFHIQSVQPPTASTFLKELSMISDASNNVLLVQGAIARPTFGC